MPASFIALKAENSTKNRKLFSNLRTIGRRFLPFKHTSPLHQFARSILYTTQPVDKVWFNPKPINPVDLKSDTITAISANLWHDFPRYRRLNERLDDFIAMVESEKADILLLQEVSRTHDLHVDEKLADRLNMAYVYSRVNGHCQAIGFEEGLAIFSRYPLRAPSLRQLGESRNPFSRRMVLGSILDTPCGSLSAFSTHLSLSSRENATQADQLRDWVESIAGEHSAIIGGDFNSHENTPQVKQAQTTWVDTFRQFNPKGDGTTHELLGPFGKILRQHRLDYIFLHPGDQGWKVVETRHLHNPHAPHSDHRSVLTRLAMVPF